MILVDMNAIWSQEDEATKLHARFDGLKLQGVGQAAFARNNGIAGGASMVSQHIKGRRPLNLEAATAYARGFGCSLAEISPRLAREVEAATAGDMASTGEKQNTNGTTAYALDVLSDCLATVDVAKREVIVALLSALVRDPADGATLGALKLILSDKVFTQEEKFKA